MNSEVSTLLGRKSLEGAVEGRFAVASASVEIGSQSPDEGGNRGSAVLGLDRD